MHSSWSGIAPHISRTHRAFRHGHVCFADGAVDFAGARGSFKAIDRVQFDAARSIGLSPWSAFRKVVLPQVLVYSIPSLGNQVVLLLKDTSLLSAITVTELTMQAKLLTEQTGAAYEAFAVVAVLYLVLVAGAEALFRAAQRAVRWSR